MCDGSFIKSVLGYWNINAEKICFIFPVFTFNFEEDFIEIKLLLLYVEACWPILFMMIILANISGKNVLVRISCF